MSSGYCMCITTPIVQYPFDMYKTEYSEISNFKSLQVPVKVRFSIFFKFKVLAWISVTNILK